MIPIKTRLLVLFAGSYSIEDEKTGILNEGISLDVVFTDNLEPVEDESAIARGEIARGNRIDKQKIPYSLKDKIAAVPGIYDCNLTMKTGSDRNTKITITDIEFVGLIKTTIDETVDFTKKEKK